MAPMGRMIRRRILLVTALLGLAVSAGAQQIATEQNRREALQFYRVGQEFLSGEQFERAAEQFSKVGRAPDEARCRAAAESDHPIVT